MAADHRILKEDEAFCAKCGHIFASGAVFAEHEGARGRCRPIEVLELVLRGDVFGFPGKDPSKKPRRTPAMAALDRLEGRLNGKSLESVKKDLARVRVVLERDRDQ